MTKVEVYNQKGDVVEKVSLPVTLFDRVINPALLHQVVVAQQANKRKRIAHTKDRSEVRGGGRKPWRQKGTGRARHGSIRSPIWRGGGVTFGPRKDRNFTKLVNKKVAKSALFMALTDRAKDKHMILIDTLSLPKLKTKELTRVMEHLPNHDAKTLLLLSRKEKNIKRVADNITNIFPYKADSLQALTVITYPYLMLSKSGLTELLGLYQQKEKV